MNGAFPQTDLQIEAMRLSRLLVVFSLLPVLGYAQSDTGLLRFESEGFSRNRRHRK